MTAKRDSAKADRLGDHARIALLPSERGPLIRKSPPTSTVTFFRGPTAAAERWLTARVATIVEANPWLGSVLDRDSDGGEMALYRPPDAGSSRRFQRREDVRLGRDDASYRHMVGALEGATCGTSEKSVGTGAPLWQVSLVPDAREPEHGFALVVSANHSLVDGHGFYRLYGMLSGEATVEALSPVRKQELAARILEATGGEPSLMAASPPGFLMRFVGGMLRNKLLPATESLGFVVDPAWIEERKGASRGDDVPYVSTNDVITSAFFRACEPDCASMTINFRGRIDGCTEDDVGNYEDMITYMPADFETPALIRRSVTGPPFVRAAVPPTRMLTNRQHLSAKYAVITNWATFARPLEIEGAEETLHLPLFDFPGTTPASVLGAMVIFRPHPGEGDVACLCGGSQDMIDRVRTSGMVGRGLGIRP